MRRSIVAVLTIAAHLLTLPATQAADITIDGVPIPAEAAQARSAADADRPLAQFTGGWVGSWDGKLKHILFVGAPTADGAVKAVYAVGDNQAWGIKPQWHRYDGAISGNILTVFGSGFTAIYERTRNNTLNARFELGNRRSQAIMTSADLLALAKPGAAITWSTGRSELLPTALVENNKPVQLEIVIYKPPGVGPFPLAIINHGSTGQGDNPKLFAETWDHVGLAGFLNERGWMVAFPQRRGRGRSEGKYDEGFAADRLKGYTCDTAQTLAGADRALQDIEAAVTALRLRPDVAKQPHLIGGQSRGAVLSVAYAGMHPEQVHGVINFVGGWVGDGCETASAVNSDLFKRGSRFAHPMLWLYGERDPFYVITHSRANFSAFQSAGGTGKFIAFEVPGNYGHFVIGHPQLWSQPVTDYLNAQSAIRQ
jgi:dienelactone hydrolase